MKKILIVNNNMKVGGVQKSLYNLLWSLEGQYDVTLCLFRATGAYLQQLPKNVRVVECRGAMRYLSASHAECTGLHKLLRGGYVILCRLLGRDRVVKFMLAGQKTLPGEYDCAVAFLHNGNISTFYGGVPEFVLKRVKAKKKVAFLHCDYGSCGANHPRNNRLVEEFDRIVACSDGCRRSFEAVMPNMKEKTVTVPNFHRYHEILALAGQEPVCYESGWIHGICVARLAHEKGIERAICAVAAAREAGHCMKLHLVGSGGMEAQLRELVAQLDLQDRVVFHGEQTNPYRYMVNADLFLLTSYHEAAPMVIDEAVSLALPVLTVKTTSSYEMVTGRQAGWVCDNDQNALNESLLSLLEDKAAIETIKIGLRSQTADNTLAAQQWHRLIEE